jgi:hypothetical protein
MPPESRASGEFLVNRARGAKAGCTAAIRPFVHHVFLEVPTVAARCLHFLRDVRNPSSEWWNFNGRERVAENFA